MKRKPFRSSGPRRNKRRTRRLCLENLEVRQLLAVAAEGEPDPEEEEEEDPPPAELLSDINTLTPGSAPGEFTAWGDRTLFVADDGIHGRELFIQPANGPARLLADVKPGRFGSNPENLTVVENTVYFTANGLKGKELYKTDGTTAGTRIVEDIVEGFGSSNPRDLTAAGGKLFFTADDGDKGRELYFTSGVLAQQLDINAGPLSSSPADLTFVPQHASEAGNLLPDYVFFSADNGINGRELWRSNLFGSTTLVSNIFHDRPNEDPNSSNPRDLVRLNGILFFAAQGGEYNEDGELESEGTELWRSDGTAAGTRLVADINEGISPTTENPYSSSPRDLVVHQGAVFFSAFTNASGREIWRSTGQEDETTQLANIRPGSASSLPAQLTSTDELLYFTATSRSGQELWKTNGTVAGTRMVKDIRPGSGSSAPDNLVALGNRIVFTANDNVNGEELWISDGTHDATRMVVDLRPGNRFSGSRPTNLAVIDDGVYFAASTAKYAVEMWASDGTAAGTRLMDLPTKATIDADPNGFTDAGGLMFFAATDGEHGTELFASNGSTGGTRLIKDIYPGKFDDSVGSAAHSSFPSNLTNVGGTLFFTANDGTHSTELWKSDGTRNGTQLVKDIEPNGSSGPRELTRIGSTLYFVAHDARGSELWKSGGTAATTSIVADLVPGGGSSSPRNLTNFNGTLFFSAAGDEGKGVELWKSDGTEEGTVRVNDINENGHSFPYDFTPVGNELFFHANDGENGEELWKTDGTEEGTTLVKDIAAGGTSSNPGQLRDVDGTLFFFAQDKQNGKELWKSDGTAENTTLVKDIRVGQEGQYGCSEGTDNLAVAFAGKLIFVADDGKKGCELWQSDGTEEGTKQLFNLVADEGEPEDDGSYPDDLLVIGDKLYFTAESSADGRELWISDPAEGYAYVHTNVNSHHGVGSDADHVTQSSTGAVYFVADNGVTGSEVWTTSLRLTADDALFEILAKEIAYRDWEPGRFLSLIDEGYDWPVAFTVDGVFEDRLNGFYAIGLTSDNIDPILAIRGSGSFFSLEALLTDWTDNLSTAGVGTRQFANNGQRMTTWLNSVFTPASIPSVTGHSLGGALTQLIAADYTNHDGLLDQVVTFNAPAISADNAGQFVPENTSRVMHYITNGDPVSMAGDDFIAGQWTRATFDDLNLLNNHLLPVIVPETFNSGGSREKPDDVRFEHFDDVSWLSHPLYFHDDEDYIVVLAAAEIGASVLALVPGIPDDITLVAPSLLFRSTTEHARQVIGRRWHLLVDPILDTLETLRCNSRELEVSVPDLDVLVLDTLQIKTTGLKAYCNPGPPSIRKLNGQVQLPQFFNATANFLDPNFIKLTPQGFDIAGSISAQEIPLVPGFLELKEVGIEINTEQNTLAAGGSLRIVPWRIALGMNMGFRDNEIDSVTASVQEINAPAPFIFPGAYLQELRAGVANIASTSGPLALEAGATLTVGPAVDVELPSWLGGNINGALVSLDIDGSVDRNHFEAFGNLDVAGGLAVARATVDVNWDRGFVSGTGSFNILRGLIQSGPSGFRADADLNLSLFGSATFRIPDVVPVVGGRVGLSGGFALNYRNDSTFSNDSAAAWTVLTLPGVGDRTMGFRAYLDGEAKLLGAEEVAEILSETEGESSGSAEFDIAAGTSWTLFSADWDNDRDVEIQLTLPSGETISESDFANFPGIQLVPDLSGATRRVVAVSQPQTGRWRLSVSDDVDLGSIRFYAAIDNAIPEVSISSVSGGSFRDPVQIDFDAQDIDDEASVSLYYDTDASGFDGIPIVDGLAEENGAGSYQWNTEGVATGEYFVYAVIDDGVNAPILSYAAAPVSITAAGIEGRVWDDANGNGVRDDGELAQPGAVVFIDANGNLQLDEEEVNTVTLEDDPATNDIDETGRYAFYDLAASDHSLRVIPGHGRVQSRPVDNLGQTVALGERQIVNQIDFLTRIAPATVSGIVWVDVNRDGLREIHEPVAEGVTVQLLGEGSSVVAATTTAADGTYEFTGVVPATYQVEFVSPTRHELTVEDFFGTDSYDSDADSQTGLSDGVTLASGETVDLDAGIYNVWQNTTPLDVTGDGFVAPNDVLAVINYLNSNNDSQLPAEGTGPPFYDVNGDGFVTPIDVLLVVNELNSRAEAEGESAASIGRAGFWNGATSIGPEAVQTLRASSSSADRTVEDRGIAIAELTGEIAETRPLRVPGRSRLEYGISLEAPSKLDGATVSVEEWARLHDRALAEWSD